MAQRTVLYDRHARLSARMVEFGGWEMPVQYEGVLAEHRHCRAAAVVFDTSHMGQFLLRGPDAAAQIAGIGTQNATALKIGRCRYGFLLNEDGGVIDDTILMRLGADEFLLVVNAGTQQGDFEWVKGHVAGAVDLKNISAAGWGKIDLQGPASFRALAPLVDFPLAAMEYFAVARGRCCGFDCIISRTGYTGELGYEIMAAGGDLAAIFDRLLEDGAVKPAGLGARDSLRLEMCYPLYGHELSTAHNPLEAGLETFVSLDPPEREFIGASRLRELAREGGPSRRLVAFQSSSRRRANPGDMIFYQGQEAGAVTSGAFSPSLEISIGMGYIRAELAEAGTDLAVATARAELPVTVREKPLYKKGTCRAKNPQALSDSQ